MKVAYKHLINFIPSKPSIEDISNKFFQLGHEHEVNAGIFDMEITPNRGDCLSINGLLRDLAVFYDVVMSNEIYTAEIKSSKNIDFINKAPKACSHISFLKIDIEENIRPYNGVLRDYFNELDVNKNNFFTDISNYISYEMGQPTHCYDAKKINDVISLEMIEGEYEFEPLMGKKILLTDENLVFLHGDNNTVVNLAGIMGGINSCCSKNTKSVLIECAYFNPEAIIGKTVKYDINSDAAHKFERGADPLCHEKVLRRFIKIVENHAHIKNIEILQRNYIEYNAKEIEFNEKQLNRILGTSIGKKEFEEYLLRLGFSISGDLITPPSYRADIKTANDIAEEIARVVGYNSIAAMPFEINKIINIDKDFKHLEQNIKNLLIKHGFYEVINNPFVKSKAPHAIKVDNPLDSNRKYLRTNLKNSLIDNLLYNERRQQDSVKLFEISDIYYTADEIKNNKILGIICSGRVGKNYNDFSKKIDESYLSNILKILSSKAVNPVHISRENLDSKLKNKIIYLEIELNDFKDDLEYESSAPKKLTYDNFIKYNPISSYPSSSRDISFSIKDVDKYYDLQDSVLNYENHLIKEIFVFDFFKNEKNNEIKLGVRFVFESKVSTITENEINNIMDNIIKSSLLIDSVSIPGLS